MAYYYLKKKKEKIRLTTKHFAGGGEGNLHKIENRGFDKYVAKIYHADRRTQQRADKIQYLLDNPPEDHSEDSALVWVTDILYDEKNNFVGFIMPYIKGEKLEVLCMGRLPRKLSNVWKRFDFANKDALSYRLRICFNLAVAVYQVHRTERYVLVDMKPENILIQPNGLVSIVDMDSVEVVDELGQVLFPAPVATPEYTPPEFYREDRTVVDTSWDRFGLSVIFYKLLFGIHPFAATANPPYEGLVSLHQKIEEGLFVHHPDSTRLRIVPPPHQAFHKMELAIQQLFNSCFVEGHLMPTERPLAEDWCDGLLIAIGDKRLEEHFRHIMGADLRVQRQRLPLPSGLLKQYSNDIIPATWTNQKIKQAIQTPEIPDSLLQLDIQSVQHIAASIKGIDYLLTMVTAVLICGGIAYAAPNFVSWLQLDFWLQSPFLINFIVFGLLFLVFFVLPRIFSYLRLWSSGVKKMVKTWNKLTIHHQSIQKKAKAVEKLLYQKIKSIDAPKLKGKNWTNVKQQLKEKDKKVLELLKQQRESLKEISIEYQKKIKVAHPKLRVLKGHTIPQMQHALKNIYLLLKQDKLNYIAGFEQSPTYEAITQEANEKIEAIQKEYEITVADRKVYKRCIENEKLFLDNFVDAKYRSKLSNDFKKIKLTNFKSLKGVDIYLDKTILEFSFFNRKSQYVDVRQMTPEDLNELLDRLHDMIQVTGLEYRKGQNTDYISVELKQRIRAVQEELKKALMLAKKNYIAAYQPVKIDLDKTKKLLENWTQKEIAAKKACVEDYQNKHKEILVESEALFETLLQQLEQDKKNYKKAIDEVIQSKEIATQRISLHNLNKKVEQSIKVLEKLNK